MVLKLGVESVGNYYLTLMGPDRTLHQLHAEIAQRVTAITREHPDWRCRKGCGNCCRQLARIPQLTQAEWMLLQRGLVTLPKAELAAVARGMATQPVAGPAPVTCPLLDIERDACRVYAQRPVACRTYGFYVQRDKGLYCRDILQQVEQGERENLVWGNHDGIDRQLANLGETRALTDWFQEWMPFSSREGELTVQPGPALQCL